TASNTAWCGAAVFAHRAPDSRGPDQVGFGPAREPRRLLATSTSPSQPRLLSNNPPPSSRAESEAVRAHRARFSCSASHVPQETAPVPPFLNLPAFRDSAALVAAAGRRVLEQTNIVDALMESKGGKKSSSSNRMYEAPLGYKIEDVRPAGGIKKFQSAAYSNCARKPS
ncbi:hypothetical protein EJB05_43064, partial [Eragrostis curvula]